MQVNEDAFQTKLIRFLNKMPVHGPGKKSRYLPHYKDNCFFSQLHDQTWQEVASVKDRTSSGYGPCGEKAWSLGSIPSTDTKQNPAKTCIPKYRANLPLGGLSMDSYIHTVLFVLKNLKWLKDLIMALAFRCLWCFCTWTGLSIRQPRPWFLVFVMPWE